MVSTPPLRLGFTFFLLSIMFVGCGSDPEGELKSALRRIDNVYYGDVEESGVQAYLQRIHNAITNGADPNTAYQGLTPLYVAIMENDTKLALLLLERGADLTPRDTDQDGEANEPPLLTALSDVEEINADMVKALIAAGAAVNGDGQFQPPLNAAVEAGSVDSVKALLQAGADPNGHAEWDSPLATAVSKGFVDLFDLLLASGARVQDSAQLLTGAAGSANPDMLERVLPLYTGSKEDLQLFQTAAWGLLLEEEKDTYADAKIIIERLQAAGFKPVPDDFTEHMIYAAQLLDARAIETMLRYGALASSANESGESCLMLAIDAASPGKIMESEIGLKGLFEYQDERANGIVRLLLDHGADVNARNKRSRTALMHAAASYNTTAVRLLLERGANRKLVDETGLDAAQVMLSSRLLKEDKGDAAGRMMRAFIGITPEFLRQAREREKQVLTELKSDLAMKSSDI